MAALQVGDRVTVGQTELTGTVMFLGSTEFSAGEWMGIELDEKAGKNDGSVKGKKYFDCKPEHGIFVRPSAVVKTSKAPMASASLEPPEKVLAPRRSQGFLAKRVGQGQRNLEKQKAEAQLELAQAMEDHDVDAIRRVLPVASNLGVDAQELEAARRILSFEMQQSLFEEVEMLRGSLAQLAESVSKLEVPSPAERLGPELEKRVWSKVLPSIDRIVTGMMAKARQACLEAYTFDHFGQRDGYISRAEFDQVRSSIIKGAALPAKASKPPKAQVPRAHEVLCHTLRRSVYARAQKVRLEMHEHPGDREALEDEAALCIQAAQRARLGRSEDAGDAYSEDQVQAALRIQAAQRARLARTEALGHETSPALARLGPELEKRVWSKVLPSIDRIVTGVIAKAREAMLEAYTFDHFDLDRDGYISRAEFDEVRSCILKGEPLPTQVKAGVQPQKAPRKVDVAKQEAPRKVDVAQQEAPRKVDVAQQEAPRKADDVATPEVLCLALRRSVYARAVKAKAPSSDRDGVTSYVRNMIRMSALRVAQMDSR